ARSRSARRPRRDDRLRASVRARRARARGGAAPRAVDRGDASRRARPEARGRGGGRRLRGRLGVDGRGAAARRARRGAPPVRGHRGADVARQAGRHLPALPAREARGGGGGRGDRRAAIRGVARVGEPPADRGGAAALSHRRRGAHVRVVAALGGNALLRRGEPAEADRQRRNLDAAAAALGAVADRHELVVTHGNGPQVGLLALEAEAYREVAPYPLDVLGAETQGMIGYLVAQALAARPVAALLTRVVVDARDPAFARPTKPIGPVYDEDEARSLAAERGWAVAADGPWFRRVVPSPEPRRIVELDAIRQLLAAGTVVVCAGGGGIPVVERDGRL